MGETNEDRSDRLDTSDHSFTSTFLSKMLDKTYVGRSINFVPDMMDSDNTKFGKTSENKSLKKLKPFKTGKRSYTNSDVIIIDESIETKVQKKGTTRVTDEVFVHKVMETQIQVYRFEGKVPGNPLDFLVPDETRGKFKDNPPPGKDLIGHNPFTNNISLSGSDSSGSEGEMIPVSKGSRVTKLLKNFSAGSDD